MRSALLLAVALTGCLHADGGGGGQGGAQACGVERWAVKTATDGVPLREADPPRAATVARLAAEVAPKWREAMPRTGLELEVVALTVFLCSSKWERGDGDYHLIVSDSPEGCAREGQETMIAEVPDPSCAGGSPYAGRMGEARAAAVELIGVPGPKFRPVAPPKRVRMVGAPFWDKRHGQRGMAQNGVEIHPVLDLAPAP